MATGRRGMKGRLVRKGHDSQHLSGQTRGRYFPRLGGAAGVREGDTTPAVGRRAPQGSLPFGAPARPPHTAAPLAVLSRVTRRSLRAVGGSVAARRRVGARGPHGPGSHGKCGGRAAAPAREPARSPRQASRRAGSGRFCLACLQAAPGTRPRADFAVKLCSARSTFASRGVSRTRPARHCPSA